MEIKCNEKRVDYLLYANKKIAAIQMGVFNFPKKGRYYKEECNLLQYFLGMIYLFFFVFFLSTFAPFFFPP